MITEEMIEIVESFERPSADYPMGSYLRTVGGVVDMATGRYALEHPGKPSPYFHGGPPFFVMDITPPWT